MWQKLRQGLYVHTTTGKFAVFGRGKEAMFVAAYFTDEELAECFRASITPMDSIKFWNCVLAGSRSRAAARGELVRLRQAAGVA